MNPALPLRGLCVMALIIGLQWAPPAQAQPAVLPDTLAQRLAPCTHCHGREGRAAPDGYHPRIAGKPAGYLFHQLLNFREGRRVYGPMVQILNGLPDAYLRDMAEHFAAIDLPYAPPVPATLTAESRERGRQLALQGDTPRGLPACTACHGERLTGMQPAAPGLLGLPRDYLIGQLGAWVNGERRAHAPDCMADIARRLQGADLVAVSTWLAAQTLPADAKPAPAATADAKPAPMRCGSVLAPSK